MAETSIDSLYHGKLALEQPRHGYRFSVDAPLLAAFAAGKRYRKAADLGAGCGVIGLALVRLDVCGHMTLIELQAGLAELARSNVARNGFESRCRVVHADLRTLKPEPGEQGYDLVVANPPYQPLGTGHPPRDEMRTIARTEKCLSIAELCRAARRLLKPSGRFCVVFPARRVDDFMAALKAQGMSVNRLCCCHPRKDEPAELVLIEARAGAGGKIVVEPPWVLHTRDGKESRLLKAILSGRAAGSPCAGS